MGQPKLKIYTSPKLRQKNLIFGQSLGNAKTKNYRINFRDTEIPTETMVFGFPEMDRTMSVQRAYDEHMMSVWQECNINKAVLQKQGTNLRRLKWKMPSNSYCTLIVTRSLYALFIPIKSQLKWIDHVITKKMKRRAQNMMKYNEKSKWSNRFQHIKC